MKFSDRYTALTTQRAYSRAVASGGLPALLVPYSVRPTPVIPTQRRRSVQPERVSA